MANPNIIPKSLHTVTVLVTVAKLLQQQHSYPVWKAVAEAAIALGYTTEQDSYGLMDMAEKKLNKNF